MNFLSENPFVQAIAASTVMAVFMIGVALGIMFMMSNSISPMPLPLILLIFAVVFITGSVFFENRGADQVGSLVGGFIASVALTFASVSFSVVSGLLLRAGFRPLDGNRSYLHWQYA